MSKKLYLGINLNSVQTGNITFNTDRNNLIKLNRLIDDSIGNTIPYEQRTNEQLWAKIFARCEHLLEIEEKYNKKVGLEKRKSKQS